MNIKIIPMPKNVRDAGGFLCVKPAYKTDCEEFVPTLHALSETADRLWGLAIFPSELPMVDSALATPLTEAQSDKNKAAESADVSLPGEERCDGGLYVKRDASFKSGEYKIETDKSCVIYAGDCEGVAAAAATLLQLAERTCDKYIKIPKGEISDCPDSSWRALLLDVARQWHPTDYLFRYVDLCFLLKINRFVIHFTDDESFTLPIECFPKLASENRSYTKGEMRALSEYAAARGVMIVPEVDMPGHCAQFLLKYPEVFGTYGIMEAGEDVFAALESIYREVAELFPESEYIHIGGDEAVLGRWDDSEKTKAYMKAHGIEDFVTLHGHYIGRAAEMILKLGKIPVVWEGFRKETNGMIPRETLVIAWESHYQLAPELLEDGFTVINASWKPLYVVSPWQKWSPDEILSWDKYTWDHWWEGSAAFKNKIVVGGDSDVCGGMLCAWGDYLKGYESCRLASQLEFASVMPRLCALSERVWNSGNGRDSESFGISRRAFKDRLDVIFGANPFRGEL